MAWIESHQELGRHPKTIRLAKKLNISIPAAIGHLHLLWWWALDFAPNGDLTNFENEEIAFAAMWESDPELFKNALLFSGYLDENDGEFYIHDWDDYAGKLIAKRAEDARRKKEERAKNNSKKGRPKNKKNTSDGHPLEIAGNSTVPNSTVPINNYASTTAREEFEPEPKIETKQTKSPPCECETINEAHTKVFGSLTIGSIYGDYYTNLRREGRSEEYIIELILEAGESSPKPSKRLLEAIDNGWQSKGIKTREEARRSRADSRLAKPSNTGPPLVERTISANETNEYLAEQERLRQQVAEQKRQRQLASGT